MQAPQRHQQLHCTSEYQKSYFSGLPLFIPQAICRTANSAGSFEIQLPIAARNDADKLGTCPISLLASIYRRKVLEASNLRKSHET